MVPQENPLTLCRQNLMKIVASPNESPAEQKAARFYLEILKNKTDRDLRRQPHFAIGVGGCDDNLITMPLVERDENGPILDDKNQLVTTECVFNNFQSYLTYLTRRLPVNHNTENCMSLPSIVNGIPTDDYSAIWFRHLGLLNTVRYQYQ